MRTLNAIAQEVLADQTNWGKTSLIYAKPYLNAMLSLQTLRDTYGADDARSIVLYFLSNASGWRGETARRVKAELKEMLKSPEDYQLLERLV